MTLLSSAGRRRGDEAAPKSFRTRRSAYRLRHLHTKLGIELLETRCLLSCSGNDLILRTYDGTCNNLDEPDWGSTGVHLLRTAPAAYADGISAPVVGSPARPSPRLISNAAVAMPVDLERNERHMSDFIYVFGQFIDHDLDLTPNASPAEPFNIPVPKWDPFFDPAGTGTKVISLNRSLYDPLTGTGIGNPREQINTLTAWLDGSVIYGSDAARAAALRSGVNGRLKTSAGDLLPFNTMGLPNDIPFGADPTKFFVAGDVRANENVELTAMHTLWMREHNRLADQIHLEQPTLNDEEIFQLARKIVGAELQVIFYKGWIPALFGPNALTPYNGYDSAVNAGIATEFSTASLRVGHTLLGDDVEFRDDEGEATHAEVPLKDAFFNPDLLIETGIDSILKYLFTDKANEVDTMIVDGVRNFLFGPPGSGGFDLASLNIQRGRDHGLADYNAVRVAYGLPPAHKLAHITSDPVLQRKLARLYSNVNNIDLWLGGLAEDHVPGTSTGPLIRRVLTEQFQRLRDGDRFWYQQIFSGAELDELENTTLTDIMRRNTGMVNIQDNSFFFELSVSGRLFHDKNENGTQDANEFGLFGWTIELVNNQGTVVETTTTDANGDYEFVLDVPGNRTVRLVTEPGWYYTTTNPIALQLSHGMIVSDVDFGMNFDGLAPGAGLGFALATASPMERPSMAQVSDARAQAVPRDMSIRESASDSASSQSVGETEDSTKLNRRTNTRMVDSETPGLSEEWTDTASGLESPITDTGWILG